jgi:hypothetical protein
MTFPVPDELPHARKSSVLAVSHEVKGSNGLGLAALIREYAGLS